MACKSEPQKQCFPRTPPLEKLFSLAQGSLDFVSMYSNKKLTLLLGYGKIGKIRLISRRKQGP